jgi:hypothetical protein
MTSLLPLTISPGSRVDSDERKRPTARVGIDTIKVGGLLAKRPDLSMFENTTQHDYGSSGETFASAGWTKLDGVKFIARSDHYGQGPYATWEVSLPTAADGHNLHPMDLPDALAALYRTYELGSELVEWAVPFEDLSIARLDSDRDFIGVEDIPEILTALSHLIVPNLAQGFGWRTVVGTHSIGCIKQGRWKAQLYNKKLELEHKRAKAAPADRPPIEAAIDQADGVLRFECRTLTSVNKEKHTATLGDLTPDLLESVNRSFFDRCHFGQEVEGRSKIHRLMAESLGEPSSTRSVARMVTYLLYESEGLGSPYSRNTNQTHKKLARDLGVSSADFKCQISDAMRLDFESGELLIDGADPKLVLAA